MIKKLNDATAAFRSARERNNATIARHRAATIAQVNHQSKEKGASPSLFDRFSQYEHQLREANERVDISLVEPSTENDFDWENEAPSLINGSPNDVLNDLGSGRNRLKDIQGQSEMYNDMLPSEEKYPDFFDIARRMRQNGNIGGRTR